MNAISGRARRAIGVACVLAAAAGGCRNPLFSDATDFGTVLPAERLRSIDRITFDRYQREYLPEEIEAAPEQPPSRFAGQQQVDLSLPEARALTLERNLDLQVALVTPTTAAARLSEEEAAFEAIVGVNARFTEVDDATSSSLQNAQADIVNFTPELRLPLRTGGNAALRLPTTRQDTDLAFATLNPSWTSDLEFSISQPLLRGAGRDATTAGIAIASYGRQVSEAQTKLEAIRQLASVDRAYWRLYASRRELDVRLQQYDLALEQLRRAQRQVNAGRAPEVEVIRAQSGLADRLEAIVVAENNVFLRQRELKRLMNDPELTVRSETVVVPASDPTPTRYEFDRDELLTSAMRTRTELLELELQLAQDAVRIDLAENAALPLFTIDYTYRLNGLGETWGDALEVAAEHDFEDHSFGLNAEIPIGNEAAKARVRQRILERLGRLRSKKARVQAIETEVLNAVDQIDSGWQRILAARQSVALNTRLLRAEERQFDVGRRTSTDVLEAAANLADAQRAEIAAITDYQIAQVDLAFATGTVLGAARVDWAPVAPTEDNLRDAQRAPSGLGARVSRAGQSDG
ncbi:MAG: TolC family protein [Planctomycetota bacterium]